MEFHYHDSCCKQGCSCIWRRRKHGEKIAPSDFNHEAGRHPYGSAMPLEYGQPDKDNGMLQGHMRCIQRLRIKSCRLRVSRDRDEFDVTGMPQQCGLRPRYPTTFCTGMIGDESLCPFCATIPLAIKSIGCLDQTRWIWHLRPN